MDFSPAFHSETNDQNDAKLKIHGANLLVQCKLGYNELFSPEMWRATVTECVGTTCLIFTLTTSVIACFESQHSDPQFLVPLAVFSIAFLLLMATIPISGGHLNPVISFIAALKGVITLVRALFYTIAQIIGSIGAYVLLKRVMSQSVVEKYALGGCQIHGKGGGISAGNALIIEFASTFLILFVAITVAFGDKGKYKEVGLRMLCVIIAGVYALAVFVSITVAGAAGYGGAGLHPARCFGSALLMGGSLWDGHWVFWLGPFLACLFYHIFSLTLPRD